MDLLATRSRCRAADRRVARTGRRDSFRVGIGGCGAASRSQTATVTGVESSELPFEVYACAVGEATPEEFALPQPVNLDVERSPAPGAPGWDSRSPTATSYAL